MMKLLMFLFSIIILMKMLNYCFIYNLLFIMVFMMLMFNNYNNNWMNIYNMISNDYISFMMSLLTIYIISLMLMIKTNKMNNIYMFLILSLLFILLLCFNLINYFMFYLFFEMSLIPTFILIMGWGYQPELINASLYMLMYTLFASLPLLIMMFMLFNYFFTMNFYFLMNSNLFINLNMLVYLIMIMAFLIKLPIYLFHLWLPKAHVEAPVIGSMILAGVMLKLGGYGIMLSLMMMMNLSNKYNLIFMTLCMIGMLNLSILCLCQTDLKMLIAYSSVVHMMMMLLGLMFMNKIMLMGALLLMISHGFCSSGLFYLVNLNYEKLKSLNLLINKGMIMILPTLSMWWFMFCMMNMSSPPSMNLVSELLILMGLFNWSFNIIIIMMMIMMFSMMYSLYIFSYSQHGCYNFIYKKINFIKMNNYINLLLHWTPINFFFLNMMMF